MFVSGLPKLPEVRVAVANFFDLNPRRCQWGPRELGDYELIHQVEGTSRYKDSVGALALLTGETLLIPPRVSHVYRCSLERPGTISCIHFSLEPDPLERRALRYTAGDGEVTHLFRRLAGEWTQGGGLAQRLCEAMLCEILARLERCGTGKLSLPRPLAMALDFYAHHYARAPARSEVARASGVTPEYLSALFQKHLGRTPVEHLGDLRFQEARRLLAQGGMSVSEVARLSGFQDPLYFSRAFRKRYGFAPSRVRV